MRLSIIRLNYAGAWCTLHDTFSLSLLRGRSLTYHGWGELWLCCAVSCVYNWARVTCWYAVPSSRRGFYIITKTRVMRRRRRRSHHACAPPPVSAHMGVYIYIYISLCVCIPAYSPSHMPGKDAPIHVGVCLCIFSASLETHSRHSYDTFSSRLSGINFADLKSSAPVNFSHRAHKYAYTCVARCVALQSISVHVAFRNMPPPHRWCFRASLRLMWWVLVRGVVTYNTHAAWEE